MVEACLLKAKKPFESPHTGLGLSPTGSLKQICISDLVLSITGSQKVHALQRHESNIKEDLGTFSSNIPPPSSGPKKTLKNSPFSVGSLSYMFDLFARIGIDLWLFVNAVAVQIV